MNLLVHKLWRVHASQQVDLYLFPFCTSALIVSLVPWVTFSWFDFLKILLDWNSLHVSCSNYAELFREARKSNAQ